MKKSALFFLVSSIFIGGCAVKRHTSVGITGEKFTINNQPTYEGRKWENHSIEGLLLNTRMVQATFDDENPETRPLWNNPDGTPFDANKNTDEFIKNMPSWYQNGVIAITVNLQGGSPQGYGNKGWINSAFDADGNLKPAYMQRMERVINEADRIGMVVILGYFYFGQDEILKNETAVVNAVNNATKWVLQKGYKNVIVEIANECDMKEYDHPIIKSQRVHELILQAKNINVKGRSLLVGTSFKGIALPTSEVVKVSDLILLHGNGKSNQTVITKMVNDTRKLEGYTPKPIVFNEDDHFNFNQDTCNYKAAIKAYASWGYFDFRKKGEPFETGYQSMPVDWGTNSQRKKEFFNLSKEISGDSHLKSNKK